MVVDRILADRLECMEWALCRTSRVSFDRTFRRCILVEVVVDILGHKDWPVGTWVLPVGISAVDTLDRISNHLRCRLLSDRKAS